MLLSDLLPHVLISKELSTLFAQLVTSAIYPRNTFLVKAGEISDRLYFLETGLARCYAIRTGIDFDKEITSWIYAEKSLLLIPPSFFGHRQSEESIQLLERSVVASLTYADLQLLYVQFPVMEQWGRQMLERYLVNYDDRLRMIRLKTAEERVLMWDTHYSNLTNRVFKKHIASFLDISPETLSRTRAVLRKNSKSK